MRTAGRDWDEECLRDAAEPDKHPSGSGPRVTSSPMKVALAHDYLTQRGGAERVVISLTRAFAGAPLFTSLYDPETTFPEFKAIDVRTLPIDRIALLRRRHRAALPLLAPAFSRLRIAADVAVCSSSGWAHGARVEGRKVVYCHTPARWLYQSERYLRGRGRSVRGAAGVLEWPLRRWDRSAARSADLYLANSTVVAERISAIYGLDAEVVPPPPALTPLGPHETVGGIDPGFVLCVSRLLPYKNVDAVVGAFDSLHGERLVVAGTGPEEPRLRASAGPNVSFAGRVTDAELRWLYANCRLLVAASYEDFGLTPLEAACFGKPTIALRWGGYLDSICEANGVFFDEPSPAEIAAATRDGLGTRWQKPDIEKVAERFSEERFIDRLRAIVGSASSEELP
jgi:glycosyltransferase involved in cell wall biosynthesis